MSDEAMRKVMTPRSKRTEQLKHAVDKMVGLGKILNEPSESTLGRVPFAVTESIVRPVKLLPEDELAILQAKVSETSTTAPGEGEPGTTRQAGSGGGNNNDTDAARMLTTVCNLVRSQQVQLEQLIAEVGSMRLEMAGMMDMMREMIDSSASPIQDLQTRVASLQANAVQAVNTALSMPHVHSAGLPSTTALVPPPVYKAHNITTPVASASARPSCTMEEMKRAFGMK